MMSKPHLVKPSFVSLKDNPILSSYQCSSFFLMHSDFDSVLRNHCGNYTILLPQCHMMLRNCYDIKNFHGGYVTQREYVPGKPKAVGLVVRSEKNKDISFLSWGGLGGRHFLRNMIFFKKNLMGMLHVSSTEHSSLICLLV